MPNKAFDPAPDRPGWAARAKVVSTGRSVIAALPSKERARLRSLARTLKPALLVGKDGLTEAVERLVGEALRRQEILKIKVLEAAPQTSREVADTLAERLEGVHLVQVVGRTLVLYQPAPEAPAAEPPD